MPTILTDPAIASTLAKEKFRKEAKQSAHFFKPVVNSSGHSVLLSFLPRDEVGQTQVECTAVNFGLGKFPWLSILISA